MEETSSAIIGQCQPCGFDTMKKNDFEVWIFHHLMHHQFHGKSNCDIGVALRMSEHKVRRYECDDDDIDSWQMLIKPCLRLRCRAPAS